MPTETLFTIDIDGTPRTIFSVKQSENGSGDLTIVIKQGEFRTEGDTYRVASLGHVIREHHISIHKSPESATNINAINHTIALADGTKHKTSNYTRAIKTNSKFAPVFMERCRDLGISRHEVKEEHILRQSLGSYSPQFFQLVYGIFVGPADRLFLVDQSRDDTNMMNIMQVPIGAFNILVISSYLGLPSHQTSNYEAFKTYPPEQIEAMTEPGMKFICTEMAEGFDEEGCIVVYWLRRQALLDQYWENRSNDNPQVEEALIPALKARSRFFLRGSPNETVYRDHIEAGPTISRQQISKLCEKRTASSLVQGN